MGDSQGQVLLSSVQGFSIAFTPIAPEWKGGVAMMGQAQLLSNDQM